MICVDLTQTILRRSLAFTYSSLAGLGTTVIRQSWGSDRRLMEKNYWISKVLVKCNWILREDPGSKIVITDCRDKNEIEQVKYWYSTYMPDLVYTVKIEREGFDGGEHESELLAKDTTIEYETNCIRYRFQRVDKNE